MKPSSYIRGRYSRVSRNRDSFVFELVTEIEGDKTCIFCDEVSGEPEKQSVYFPPARAAEKLLVDGVRGQIGYCCQSHYARYTRISNAGVLFPTFEEFYVAVGGVIVKRARGEGSGMPSRRRDGPRALRYFRVTSDLGVEGQNVWYSGFGYLEQIRIRHPLYEKFNQSIHENMVLGRSVEWRRDWFKAFCSVNEVHEKELRAFEHFLKL